MGRSVRQPLASQVPARERRPELIRPSERRPDFTTREAQRRLRQKERPWAPVAYAVFFLAMLTIGFFAYSTYLFSKYRGVVLPGTQVDQLNVSGLTEKQAANAILIQLAAIHKVPVRLTYGQLSWHPNPNDLGLSYNLTGTARAAMQVGRAGSPLGQLIDRLPLHPTHYVPLIYTINERSLVAYVHGIAANHNIRRDPQPALLLPPDNAHGYHVRLVPSQPGTRLNVTEAEDAIRNALGSLSIHEEPLEVDHVPPVITDQAAAQVRARVEHFLAHTPVIALGKRVMTTPRMSFGPMLTFTDQTRGHPTIKMNVDPNRVHAYIRWLASQIDRPAVNARMDFQGGQVRLISPQQTGRQLDQDSAFRQLLPVVSQLKPNARLHFKVVTIQPPVDTTNPASLGIRRLLATGVTSFAGAGPTRLADITAIARQLNQSLITPSQDISLNTLATTNWLDRVYSDAEREVGGQLVPGRGGAMQQVATTFLRALYAAGLRLEERHAHPYRLPWYEPPVGEDAIVAPGRGWDLRFANNTGKYLLIETRVEPIQQRLYIYVYGPQLGWHVAVDTQGQVTKTYPHGGRIERVDPSLPPGQVRQISWATNGADTVVQRTITYPNGTVHEDALKTTYQPAQSIITVGRQPTPTPTPVTAHRAAHPRSTATPTPAAAPTPTATFSH
jgi:vancomycin resistance protein YoaR